MKARWIFFDLDGTLADSLPGLHDSIVEALGSGGRQLLIEDLRSYIGPGIRTILKRLQSDLTEAELDGMERCFRACYDTKGVKNTRIFDGVMETLAKLKTSGAELFVVTNKPRQATENLFEQHGMKGLFVEVLCRNSRDPAFVSKSEMLRELVVRHGVEPRLSLMVGDTIEDHEAATEAGMPFVFAEYGYGKTADTECLRIARFPEIAEVCQRITGPVNTKGSR